MSNLTSIKGVIDIISSAFKLNFSPQPSLPPPLIFAGGKMRQGLSAQQIAARIISRQQEAGAPIGVLVDGSDNVSERMEKIRVEEMVNAILTEAKIEISIPPGIPVSAVGGGIGVVTVQGATTDFASGSGIMQ
jgi:hypothetical protein